MQWMQDANAKFVETQKQQIKTATEMFNKSISASQVNDANNFNDIFGSSSKALVDLVQKNVETTTNLLKTTLKPVTEFSKFSDKDSFAKEINKQVETMNQKIADLTLANQTNLDLILKQMNSTTNSFNPLEEQFKKELEKTAESTKETVQTIVDSYSSFTAPTMEANKETFDKINEQIKSAFQANVKFWSDLTNQATTAAKTQESKVDNNALKITAAPTNKKQTATTMN
jgi:uncharacterized protein YeaO (DUF488 family)